MSADGAAASPRLVCEELFLLLTGDSGGREGFGTQRGIGMAAAVVIDLVAAGRVTVEEGKGHRLRVTDPAPIGDPVLDAALQRILERDGTPLATLVRDRKLNPESAVGARLAEGGVLDVHEARLGGLVPAKYPTVDPEPERALRARLSAALTGGPVTERDLTILSVVLALGVHARVLGRDLPGWSARDIRTRIHQLGSDTAFGDAVATALRTIAAAVATAGAIGAVSS